MQCRVTGRLFWPMWRARIVHLADKNAYAVAEGGGGGGQLPPHDPPLPPEPVREMVKYPK